MKHDLFLSYSSKDLYEANSLNNFFSSIGINCWIDQNNIRFGLYADKIMKAIDKSKVFLLILSPNSFKSRHVRTEVKEAFEKEIEIITVKIDEVELDDSLRYYTQIFPIIDCTVNFGQEEKKSIIGLIEEVYPSLVKRSLCEKVLKENESIERSQKNSSTKGGLRERLIKEMVDINSQKKNIEYEKFFYEGRDLIIQGDSLKALSFLSKEYYQKVKMIYVEPPMNLQFSYLSEEENSSINLMYQWIYFSRHLLRDDGCIFISLNDTNLSVIKSLMDEIYGMENFICNFVWRYPRRNKSLTPLNEYILVYTKENGGLKRKENELEELYPYIDAKGRWRKVSLQISKDRPSLYFSIIDPATGEKYFPDEGKVWRYSKNRIQFLIGGSYIYFQNNKPVLKEYLDEVREKYSRPVETILEGFGDFNLAKSEFKRLLPGTKINSLIKPVGLIKYLIKECMDKEDIVLDLTNKLGTTGQAIIELNAEDNGKRKFILIHENNTAIEEYNLVITEQRLQKVMHNNNNFNGFEKLKIESNKSATIK